MVLFAMQLWFFACHWGLLGDVVAPEIRNWTVRLGVSWQLIVKRTERSCLYKWGSPTLLEPIDKHRLGYLPLLRDHARNLNTTVTDVYL
jgi:hypothetical protein